MCDTPWLHSALTCGQACTRDSVVGPVRHSEDRAHKSTEVREAQV